MRIFLFCFLLTLLPLYSFAQKDSTKAIIHTHIKEKIVKEGWRIQIYKGSVRQEAIDAKKKAYTLPLEVTPTVYMDYGKPNYRVRVGDFIDLVECEKVLAQLKTAFPDATIVKAMVTLLPNYKED
jgi:hypothetical protein